MQLEARMLCQLGLFLRVLVSGVVIHDQMQVEVAWRGPVDLVQDTQKLLVAMPLHAAARDRASCHIECGKQGRGAIAFIVVDHRAGAALLERQAWLGVVVRLDLRHLIDRENPSLIQRIEIEANHILDLLDKALGRVIA